MRSASSRATSLTLSAILSIREALAGLFVIRKEVCKSCCGYKLGVGNQGTSVLLFFNCS